MIYRILFLAFLFNVSSLNSYSQEVPISSFESYFLKTGNYPSDDTNIWMGNGLEVQGVTNDGANWYFTVTKKDESGAYLWRIPKQYDLNQVQLTDSGVDFITFQETPLNSSFWHWGDPDHYAYDSDGNEVKEDYILVPIPGIIACFRVDGLELEYVNYANLGSFQDYAGWCAIGIDGRLYSSDNYADDIKQYEVNWDMLVNTSNHNALTYIDDFELEFLGNDYNELRHMQGGEFSDNGELLYIISGSAGCDIVVYQFQSEPEPSDGIHVFETVGGIWSEIAKSENSGNFDTHFSYTFDNTCACQIFGSQTPEGLTVWDLEDDDSVPNIKGSLHVLLDHYNVAFCDDAVTFQHFSNRIYADSANGELPPFSPQTGKKSLPYKKFNDAIFEYSAWNGAEIILKQGNYDDQNGEEFPIVIDKRLKINSEGGSAIIGNQ